MKKPATVDSTSSGANEGWAVLSTLIAGFVVWGGIGFLLDRWLGTKFLTPVGVIVGMVLGIYAVVARYGRPSPQPPGQGAGAAASGGDGPTAAAVRRETR